MVRLRRIPAIRAANMLALTFGIPYLIIGLVGLVFLMPWTVTTSGTNVQPTTTFVGLESITALLVGWFVAMLSIWLFVAIACGLYNLFAGRFGGIELEFTTLPPQN